MVGHLNSLFILNYSYFASASDVMEKHDNIDCIIVASFFFILYINTGKYASISLTWNSV